MAQQRINSILIVNWQIIDEHSTKAKLKLTFDSLVALDPWLRGGLFGWLLSASAALPPRKAEQ
jgi:hypothetical protein